MRSIGHMTCPSHVTRTVTLPLCAATSLLVSRKTDRQGWRGRKEGGVEGGSEAKIHGGDRDRQLVGGDAVCG